MDSIIYNSVLTMYSRKRTNQIVTARSVILEDVWIAVTARFDGHCNIGEQFWLVVVLLSQDEQNNY